LTSKKPSRIKHGQRTLGRLDFRPFDVHLKKINVGNRHLREKAPQGEHLHGFCMTGLLANTPPERASLLAGFQLDK
jgi:hypothetical protein